ncbi:copper homeostasis protein CutC [Jiulongibacter sediminis]|uniref:PF03932 family protein CutC n=1 Tax=Jiulongibacter sediminis TaxID=1605367 RepID=A0A0P7BRV6_9BACT|nr:copper homeostasis protein CutC [Jiulongibacter sediminis]KPM47112.1 copper homeostasis protein CutC [Jiulongibacter sediminis]TBX22673.1 copper homeostasis protein CutC [Jiulongibacter sediminis]
MADKKYHFELCSFTIESSRTAQKAGASRVELCDNPIEGGTTPSYGVIKAVRNKIDIELYPIIRPRSLNYFYSDDEWESILEDARICKELECDGISIGVQKQNGEVDTEKMKALVELAYPLKVTSNRVIDAAPDPFEALDSLIEAGCYRVLTSGQAAAAPEGIDVLKKLVEQANGRISIMPGAGVNSGNIASLAKATGAFEFHASARIKAQNPVNYQNPKILDSGDMFIADFGEVKAMVDALNALQ